MARLAHQADGFNPKEGDAHQDDSRGPWVGERHSPAGSPFRPTPRGRTAPGSCRRTTGSNRAGRHSAGPRRPACPVPSATPAPSAWPRGMVLSRPAGCHPVRWGLRINALGKFRLPRTQAEIPPLRRGRRGGTLRERARISPCPGRGRKVPTRRGAGKWNLFDARPLFHLPAPRRIGRVLHGRWATGNPALRGPGTRKDFDEPTARLPAPSQPGRVSNGVR